MPSYVRAGIRKCARIRALSVSMDGFINMLDGYMVWYRDKRIKTEFGHGHHGSSTRARLVA